MLKILISSLKFKINRLIYDLFIFNFLPKKKIFTSIWKNNYWANSESVSGPGSTLEQTKYLLDNLPNLFKKFKIRTIFDAPCGDFNWMRYLIKKVDLNYMGGDIVTELIDQNNKLFASDKIKFTEFDLTTNNFPKADLWLCRHILFHFSDRDIFMALKRFSQSEINYILVTNCITNKNFKNKNIRTGSWRLLNLTLPPFNLPQSPLYKVIDSVSPSPPMELYLYSRKQIIDSLKN